LGACQAIVASVYSKEFKIEFDDLWVELEGEGNMDVMSLRLPYIFGTMPGRMPLWEMFIPQIKGKDVVPVLGGGTAMVTVQQVAEATIGALEHSEHGGKYAISSKNMKHRDFFQIIADVLGQGDTEILGLAFGNNETRLCSSRRTSHCRGQRTWYSCCCYCRNSKL
jgi:nucleoside-diphosphate-sugar epimerase